jgi:regulator of protease activity HflC (stomatin/prohibitin superfamily)
MFYSSPHGVYTLLFRNGAFEAVLDPGLHVTTGKPLYLVTRQHIVLPPITLSVLTSDTIAVQIVAGLTFRISRPWVFLSKIGVSKLESTLRSALEDGVSQRAFSLHSTKILDLKGADIPLEFMNQRLDEVGLIVEKISITDVILPQDSADALAACAIADVLQARDYAQQQLQTLTEQYAEELEKLRTRHEADLEANAEQENQQTPRDVALLHYKRIKETTEVEEEMRRQIALREAETQLQIAQINAEAEEEIAQLHAKANKIEAHAEALVAQKLTYHG